MVSIGKLNAKNAIHVELHRLQFFDDVVFFILCPNLKSFSPAHPGAGERATGLASCLFFVLLLFLFDLLLLSCLFFV